MRILAQLFVMIIYLNNLRKITITKFILLNLSNLGKHFNTLLNSTEEI